MVEHRLAAVWFADIGDYAALSARDEDRALSLAEIEHSLAQRAVERFGGEIVRSLGDRVLAVFSSTDGAVRAARAFSAAYRREVGEGHDLRICVHLGEVARTGSGDIYGNGVNVADRLRKRAAPGQLVVTEDVWNQLRRRKEFEFRELDVEILEGLGRYRLYEVLAAAGAADADEWEKTEVSSPSSVAGEGATATADEPMGQFDVLRSWVAELKRRKVIRVAAAYAATAFVVIELASIVFDQLMLPPWSARLVTILALLGFPIALVLAWAFEVTPEGVARESSPPARERLRLFPEGVSRKVVIGVGVVALLGVVAFWRLGWSDAGASSVSDEAMGLTPAEFEKSVAVLPCENRSGDPDQQYLSDGISDEIRVSLGRVGELRVVKGRRTSTRNGGTERSPGEIADEHRVRYVLECAVNRDGDSVAVTAHFLDATNNTQLWAESYTRRFTGLFAIQTDIADRIADALEVQLTDRDPIQRSPPQDVTAYDFYLQARDHFYRLTLPENRLAEELYRRSLEVDSTYAPAYAGLASVYVHRSGLEGRPAPGDSALALAERAVSLAPDEAHGYEALADVYLARGDLEEALDNFRQAIELQPNFPKAAAGIGVIHGGLGRFDRALTWLKRAARLDPMQGIRYVHVGNMYFYLGEFRTAERWYRRGLEVQPDLVVPQKALALLLTQTHEIREARRYQEGIVAGLPERPSDLPFVAFLHLLRGELDASRRRFEEALEVLEEPPGNVYAALGYVLQRQGRDLQRSGDLIQRGVEQLEARVERGGRAWEPHYELARAYAVAGDEDAAIQHLRRAYEGGWRHYLWYHPDPLLDTLRDDERFRRLIDRIDADLAELRASAEASGD